MFVNPALPTAPPVDYGVLQPGQWGIAGSATPYGLKFVPMAMRGQVFYVNYGGDDNNNGLSTNAPFLTLTAALAACTDDLHDIIYVLNWWLNEAGPIVCNKRMVTIVGAPSGSLAQPAIQIADSGVSAAMFNIATRDVIIQNFIIQGGATNAAVEFTAGAGNVRGGLYNCYFRACQYGVHADGNLTPSEQLTVAGCYFEGSLTAGGILYNSNGPFCQFSNNVFDALPGIGISVTNGPGAGRILNNIFALDSNVNGRAINMGGTSNRWLIDGNHANFADTTMGNNPYQDVSVPAGGVANNWGSNWNGTGLTDPV